MKRTIIFVLLLLVPASAVVMKTAGHGRDTSDEQGAKEKAARKGRDSDEDLVAKEKWEYLVLAGPSNTNFTSMGSSTRKEPGNFSREAYSLEQHLDGLGGKGWELVSIAGSQQDPVFYFKRAK